MHVLHVVDARRNAVQIASATAARSETRELVGLQQAPARAGDVRHSQADIGRASEVLGYAVLHGFDAGLERTVRVAA